MACCYPLKAYKTGFLTDKGKDEYEIFSYGFSKKTDLQLFKKNVDLSKVSYIVDDGHIYLDDPVDIPCGKCVGCRMDVSRQWKIRCCLEVPYHRFCYFITLTYDDDHLPFSDFGEPVLVKEDLQKFWKRFRKAGYELSYFACGEYGDRFGRPHFHALVYLDKDLQGFQVLAPYKYVCETISKLWSFGNHYVEEVSPGNIAYVCGYVEKKQRDGYYDSYPVPPFRVMSRCPGVGMSYIKDHLRSIESTKKVYGIFSDDCRSSHARIPRSLLRKFEGTAWYEQVKEASKLAAESHSEVVKVVFGTSDLSKIGDIREFKINQIIDKKRSIL